MKISISLQTISDLNSLHSERKFDEEDFYPGAPTEEERVSCEGSVNDFISDILVLGPKGIDREVIFSRTRRLIETFEGQDTEEREKVDDYVAQIMMLLGIGDWEDHV